MITTSASAVGGVSSPVRGKWRPDAYKELAPGGLARVLSQFCLDNDDGPCEVVSREPGNVVPTVALLAMVVGVDDDIG